MDIDWIREGLLKPGKTQRGLALALGIDASAVSRLLKGDRQLKASEVPVIAAYLGDPAPEALQPPPPIPPGPVPGGGTVSGLGGTLPAANADLLRIRTGGGGSLVGERDLPVYASAQGGPGSMIIAYDPIQWVKRPEPLFGVPDGFAIYCVGDSMEPAYSHGDLLLVHPRKPAWKGDDVLLVLESQTGDLEALFKRLVAIEDHVFRLQQWNPASLFDVPRARVRSASLVVGKYNRQR